MQFYNSLSPSFLGRVLPMIQQNSRKSSQPRASKGSNPFLLITIAVLVMIIAGLYYQLQKRPTTSPVSSTGVGDQLSPQKEWATSDHRQELDGVHKDQDAAQPTEGTPSRAEVGQINDHAETKDTLSGQQAVYSDLKLNNTDINTDTLEQGRPQIDRINAFYSHLDEQPYIQNFGLNEPSKIYFSKLLQTVADHPPTVIRETDNLYTLLHNTTQFFRVLGKKNITILKKIMATESSSFEQTAQAFYKLTAHPEYLKKEYALVLPPQVMSDYAVFFLNTMGGRLYLFRRDSTTRMVVTFYAIMTLDRANIAGNSGHGVDLRPAILALIEEMENGGKHLQLKEQYLDALYDLQEKYN